MDGSPEDVHDGETGGPRHLAGERTTRVDTVPDGARQRPGNRNQGRSVAGKQAGHAGSQNLRDPVHSPILERMDRRPDRAFVDEQRTD